MLEKLHFFNVKIIVILILNIFIIFLSLLNTIIPVIYVKLNIFLLIRFIYRNILPVLLQLMHLTKKQSKCTNKCLQNC